MHIYIVNSFPRMIEIYGQVSELFVYGPQIFGTQVERNVAFYLNLILKGNVFITIKVQTT